MLVRTFTFASLSFLSLLACGSDGTSKPPDAPAKDIGFNKPTAALKGNMEIGTNKWMELGPADLTCLNTPSADVATTVTVKLATKVTDFMSDAPQPASVVTAFKDSTVGTPFDTQTADADAKLTITIPIGTKRFGYKMTNANSLDTLLLNQTVDPDPNKPNQMVSSIQSVSKSTATTLPAIIGSSRTPGTGVLAGALRDCAGKEVSNFIATVSKTKGTADIADGADSYYFSPGSGLPVRHSQQELASANGLFMVIELAPAPNAFVQIWGYRNDADVGTDNLTLIAELAAPVIADTVITGSYEPLRSGQ